MLEALFIWLLRYYKELLIQQNVTSGRLESSFTKWPTTLPHGKQEMRLNFCEELKMFQFLIYWENHNLANVLLSFLKGLWLIVNKRELDGLNCLKVMVQSMRNLTLNQLKKWRLPQGKSKGWFQQIQIQTHIYLLTTAYKMGRCYLWPQSPQFHPLILIQHHWGASIVQL